jgi:hypothetical protein
MTKGSLIAGRRPIKRSQNVTHVPALKTMASHPEGVHTTLLRSATRLKRNLGRQPLILEVYEAALFCNINALFGSLQPPAG